MPYTYILALWFAALTYFTGIGNANEDILRACVTKHTASMSHDKATEYCTTLLKFESDSK